MRVAEIKEHLTTIEKAMDQIQKLSTNADENHNQIVRWVVTKEDHANKIQHICSQYFMSQRVKPVGTEDAAKHAKFITELTALHALMRAAMTCKQGTSPKTVAAAREALAAFEKSYFAETAHTH